MLRSWDTLAHPDWGLPLDLYLAQPEINQTPLLYLDLGRIIQSLNLLKTGEATCETLELCLTLANDHNALRLIIRENLLSGCMLAVRDYFQENDNVSSQ